MTECITNLEEWYKHHIGDQLGPTQSRRGSELATVEAHKTRWLDFAQKAALKWRSRGANVVSLEIEAEGVRAKCLDGAATGSSFFETGYWDSLAVRPHAPVRAAVPVAELLNIVELVYSPFEPVEVRFLGREAVAHECEITSSCLEVSHRLPDVVDLGVGQRILSCDTETTVRVESTKLKQIAEAVDLDGVVDAFPLMVKDGQFVLDLPIGAMDDEVDSPGGDRARVWNTLDVPVSGPDVMNFYGEEFERFVKLLDGTLELRTSGTDDFDDQAPVLISKSGEDYELEYRIEPVDVEECDWTL